MKTNGFTLVELSIVMIIIGLLIGGVFGGMRLVENAQVSKTIQDIKSIESATLTFRDTYGRLPGDLRNPSTRLPNCTTVPCATGGNGNRRIENTSGGSSDWSEPITATMEKFTFWHHLQASNLLHLDYSNTTSLEFGEGQPIGPFSGYRIFEYTGDSWGCVNNRVNATILSFTNIASGDMQIQSLTPICREISSMDRKIDDGRPLNGKVIASICGVCDATQYDPAAVSGIPWYDLQGF
jgi:prepilin-type N-terminal cleavage/methylation domain-containing protein